MRRLTKAWLKLRITWSNTKNKRNLVDMPIVELINTPKELETISKKLYKNFYYTYDNIDQLGDSQRFPAQCYKELKDGCLKDDCDGYHAALYHIANKRGIKCYLLTYITKSLVDSHTVLLMHYGGRYYKLDYDRLSSADTIKKLITKDIYCWNLTQFDYDKKKWVIVDE